MPEAWLDSLEPGDEPGTVRVTSAYPHVFPLLESATSRRWREAVAVMHLSRAVDVNRPLLEEQLGVRRQMAELFGEASWAHHRLHPRMARTPETVEAFYADLLPRLAVPGERERAILQTLLDADIASGDADGDPVLGDHDWRYYDSRLRQSLHGVDPWVVAEHFPFDLVLAGLLDLTAEMFGIVYEPVELSTWHPDVRGPADPRRRQRSRGRDRPPRPVPARGQVLPRRRLRDRDRAPPARRHLPPPGHRDGHELHGADRGHAVAAHPRRGHHVLPRVGPRPAHEPQRGAVRAARRGAHRVGLRRGTEPDPRALGLGPRRAVALRAVLRHRRAAARRPARQA